jgi:hypothetical protein
MRLQSDHVCITAYGYNIKAKVMTGIVPQVNAAEEKAIQDRLMHYSRFLGQELLFRRVLIEICLDHCNVLLIGLDWPSLISKIPPANMPEPNI